MKILKLQIQALDKKDIIRKRDIGYFDDVDIMHFEQGYYSSLEKLKDVIKESVEDISENYIITNIYAEEIPVDEEEVGYGTKHFLDKEGNVVSKQYDDDNCLKNTLKPSFKIGDYVIVLGNDKTELGIISAVPNLEWDHRYGVLTGSMLHSHCHPTEQDLIPLEDFKNYGYQYKYESVEFQDLQTRLQIGW